MNSTVGYNKIINFLSKRMINSPILLYLHIPRLVCKCQNSKSDYNPITFSVNRKREHVIHVILVFRNSACVSISHLSLFYYVLMEFIHRINEEHVSSTSTYALRIIYTRNVSVMHKIQNERDSLSPPLSFSLSAKRNCYCRENRTRDILVISFGLDKTMHRLSIIKNRWYIRSIIKIKTREQETKEVSPKLQVIKVMFRRWSCYNSMETCKICQRELLSIQNVVLSNKVQY